MYTIKHVGSGFWAVINPKGRQISLHYDANSAGDKADRLNMRYFGRFA